MTTLTLFASVVLWLSLIHPLSSVLPLLHSGPIFCLQVDMSIFYFFFFSSRRRHTRSDRDWSSDVCSSDLLFMADRGADGNWRKITYGQTLEKIRRVGAALLTRNLSTERPIVILSGNEIGRASCRERV